MNGDGDSLEPIVAVLDAVEWAHGRRIDDARNLAPRLGHASAVATLATVQRRPGAEEQVLAPPGAGSGPAA